MAARRKHPKKPTLTKEQREYVKHMREAGYLVYFTSEGNVGATPRKVGATRGHRSCHR